jgi:hypothetical protein
VACVSAGAVVFAAVQAMLTKFDRLPLFSSAKFTFIP